MPLPKSDTPSRIEANADVFGFEIDEEDMKALDGLDQGDKGAIGEFCHAIIMQRSCNDRFKDIELTMGAVSAVKN